MYVTTKEIDQLITDTMETSEKHGFNQGINTALSIINNHLEKIENTKCSFLDKAVVFNKIIPIFDDIQSEFKE